jgi:multidrug resistance efflux pump
VETVDLPGASVHGFETAVLESKVGGYVESIGKVKNKTTGQMDEFDIGAVVQRGQLLTELEAPELMDELREKKARVVQAKSVVAQAQAMIDVAEANVAIARARLDEARTELQEKEALRDLSQAEYENQRKLFEMRASTRELADKARANWDAASAALLTVDARIRTAEAGLNAAVANRQKAAADYRNAQAQVEVATAAEARAKTWVDYAQITAPFTGVISKRMVDHGTFVRPATNNASAVPLFEIVRIDKVQIEASVPMSLSERIRVGQPVLLHTIGGLPGVTVAGKLTRSGAVLAHDTRMLKIHVDLSNPVQHSHHVKQSGNWTQTKNAQDGAHEVNLKPGMFGTLTLMETWDDLTIAPTTALGTDESGNPYVLVVEDEQGKLRCRRQTVTVVFNDAKDVGISSGVQAGETVVARNLDRVDDGELVVVTGAS